MNIKNKYFLLYFFIFIIFPLIFLQRFYSFFSLEGYDNGVFAYIGDMIRYGHIPYRDMWDHKSPLIYYINAFSFSFFGSHIKTIAFVEFAWLCAGSVIFYRMAKQIFDRKLSLISAVFFTIYMSSLQTAEEVGMTEIYLEICAATSVFFILKFDSLGRKYLLFASGLFAGFSFLFKQPGGIIMVPILFFLALENLSDNKKIKQLLVSCSIWIGSFLLPAAVFTLYFWSKNALDDAISQIFVFNFIYSDTSAGIFTRIKGFLDGIFAGWETGIMLVALAFLGTAKELYSFIKTAKLGKIKQALYTHRFFILALVWFISDCYAISYSGKYYDHYFLQLIASASILSAFAIEFVLKLKLKKEALIVMMIIAFAMSPLIFDIDNVLKVFKTPSIKINGLTYRDFKKETQLISWILDNTSGKDYIYFFGGQTRLNFITQRKCPAKYIYLTPLKHGRYTKFKDVVNFINEIEKNKPKLIIFKNNTGSRDKNRGYLAYAYFYIDKNYEYTKTIKSIASTGEKIRNWHIYKLKG